MNRIARAVALGLSTAGLTGVVFASDGSISPPPPDVTEILPPVEQYDRIYDTRDHALAQLLAGRIEDELGGEWHIPIWDPYSSTARRAYGSGIQLTQDSLTTREQVDAVARTFIAEHPALFGNAAVTDLRTHRITRGSGKWGVLLQQTKEGIPVTDAMVNLVITETGRLFAFGSGFYETISAPTTPLIDANDARAIARAGLPADTDTSRYARPTETQILPTLDTRVDPPQMTFRLAHKIDVPTENPDGLYEVYVDAVSGEILRRVSQTMNSFSGTVTGDVDFWHPCDGPAVKALGNLDLTVGGNSVTTGSDGSFSASGSGSSTYAAKLSGPYVDVETATRYDDNGRYSSIAVDPATGDISIAFQNFDGRDLYYAKKSSGRWTIELVDMRGDATIPNGVVGEYASVALVGGVPHVAYLQNDAPPRLRYARRTGGTWVWTTETVPDGTTNNYGLHSSLEMSGSNPMIAYEDAQNSDLRFSYKYNGQWYSEIVESPASGFAGPYASLMLTATGIPRIAYYSNGDLKYASRAQVPSGYSTNWTISTVDAPGDVGRYASLARDAAGSPLVTYYDAGNGDLKFARRPTGVTWQATMIDGTSEDVGKFSSMARASDGTLHVAYYRDDVTTQANRALKYVTRSSGGNWQTPVVLEAGNVGQYCSIALDNSNRPRISYYDSQNQRLKLAWHDGTAWNFETVQPQDIELTGPIFDGQSAQIHFQGGAVNWAETDAFYFANVAYDYAKSVAPEWWPPAEMPKATIFVDDDALANAGGQMDAPFSIRLRIGEEGGPPPAQPLVSRARVASIVGHEYSHGMAYWLCGQLHPNGPGVSEGNADIGSTFVTDAA